LGVGGCGFGWRRFSVAARRPGSVGAADDRWIGAAFTFGGLPE